MNTKEFETKYVHNVYDTIHKRFNETRYSAWRAVDEFISTINPMSIVLDVGCGNGKYANIRTDISYIGLDASQELAHITKQRNVDSLISNALYLPFRNNSIDNILCIAMLHHISTNERRYQCIKEIIRVLKNNGTAIITVWAQELNDVRSKKWTKINDEGDYFVPWKVDDNTTCMRYYHFFSEQDIINLLNKLDNVTSKYYFDRNNWNIILRKNLT